MTVDFDLMFSPQYEEPEVWDVALFNGEPCPGIVEIDPDRGNKWDRKPSDGEHGEVQTFKGTKNADVSILVRLRTGQEYLQFNERILPMLEPVPGKKKPDSIELDHPALEVRNIRHINVDNVKGPKVVGEENHYTIKAFEFRKPEAKNATGNATGAGGLSVRCIGINAELEARNLVMATTDDPVQYAENLAKSNLLALEADSIGCPIAVHTTPNQPPQADDSILEELWPF